MAYLWVLLVAISFTWEVNCSYDNKYYNHTFLRVFPSNEREMDDIYHFEDPLNKVEILKRSRGINDSLDLLVPPERLNFVTSYIKNTPIEVKSVNYGKSMDSIENIARRRALDLSPFTYMSYNQILDFVSQIANRHRSLVQLQPVGKSYQGREMVLIKISSNPNAGNPVIFIDAGVHSREWVAPNMALYLIHRLTNDAEARATDLNGVDWYILPMVNPDGYEYSRSGPSHRMWRKTRSKNSQNANDNCLGADGNRNYGFKWAVSGVSHNPCDRETFAGPKPFSEPETRIVRNIMMSNKDRIKLYVSVHAYGNYLVYPWGYTGDLLPRSWRSLDRLARQVSDAIVSAGGQPMKVLSAGKWYPAAGGSDDFAFGAVGIPYSYTMELTDGYEFIYPENLLSKVLPQFYEGFRVFGREIYRQFGNS